MNRARCLEEVPAAPWSRAPSFYPEGEHPATARLRDALSAINRFIAYAGDNPETTAARDYFRAELAAFQAHENERQRKTARILGERARAGVFPASPIVVHRGSARDVLDYLTTHQRNLDRIGFTAAGLRAPRYGLDERGRPAVLP